MGLFGFGKKKHQDDEVADGKRLEEVAVAGESAKNEALSAENSSARGPKKSVSELNSNVDANADTDAVAEEETDEKLKTDAQSADENKIMPSEPAPEYVGRGELYGPWDVEDENVVDYDEYLDLGAYYLPFLQNIELRIKANRASGQVIGCTITYGSSSLEIEAFAAPKTLGLWDDVRSDLLESNEKASEVEGVFGMEARLPVSVKGGKTVVTRIVGIDGPRWMLRGIFSGKAATGTGEETEALNRFFARIVVERGEEPLAPRDLIPMHQPVAPSDRKATNGEETKDDADMSIPERPTGPFDSDQTTEVKTTLSRGPMFSEVR